ncbi:MAG TPA: creatininase family protein [Casimicrobiaceae bacterium]|nr:creatininase family protein [Casimicrobiaceae bacterium]
MPRRLSHVALACIFAAVSTLAHSRDSVFIDELTSPELAANVRGGKTTVLIPIGGTEQSGPHIVLGKHNVRVKILAQKIAESLGNALVAPVVAYVPEGNIDPPSAHMRFAGTISVPAAAFEGVLEGAARSLRAHGFRDIVFLGDHGGYQRSEQVVAARLDREWARSPARVHALTAYYTAAETDFAAALAARGFRKAAIGTHAGLADTSLSLAVDPSLVRQDKLASSRELDASHGVYGDPRGATAALGQLGVDAIVRRSVEAIRAANRR